MDPFTWSFLLAAGFAAAFFDSIVGGGGAISLPALLAVGLPPHLALGTNKLAATGASLVASARYVHAQAVRPRLVLPLIPLSVAGSFMGVVTALRLDARSITGLVIVAMGLVSLYVALHPGLGRVDGYRGFVPWRFAASAAAALGIGFYDGLLGPGTGTFLLFAFLGLQRFDFVRAAGHARVLNFASNAGALALFFLLGHVEPAIGLPMFGAMAVGGWFGSHVGLKHGHRWIRPLFLGVALLLMARLALGVAGVQGF